MFRIKTFIMINLSIILFTISSEEKPKQDFNKFINTNVPNITSKTIDGKNWNLNFFYFKFFGR